MSESDPYTARAFKPLGEYDFPAMPAEHIARRFFDRFKTLFVNQSDNQLVNRERLHRTSQKKRDDVTSPPDCGPLLNDLNASIDSWLDDSERATNIRLFVMPPCQQSNLLAWWARQHHQTVLQTPSRVELISQGHCIPEIHGSGILVIPELSYWFMRHRQGLTTVRSLLAALAKSDRQCIVGCNSWAWTYLCRAANADLLLPPAQMFQAFDDQRLRAWFTELAAHSYEEHTKFRLVETGADVLALDSDGELECDYLTTLSAHSLGIPWIAWHIWRRCLRTMPESEAASRSISNHVTDNEDTLWLVEYWKYILPESQLNLSLMILHALLIHGTLTRESLDRVLPCNCEDHSVDALLSLGFVDEADGLLSCAPGAYPATRQYLVDAGFPVDRL